MLKILTIVLWAVIVILHAVAARSHNHHHHHHIPDYCKLKCPPFDPPRGAVFLPGPTKYHYYKCHFGVGVLFRCSRGRHFNPKKRVCDKARRANAVVCQGSPNHEGEGSGDDGFTSIWL